MNRGMAKSLRTTKRINYNELNRGIVTLCNEVKVLPVMDKQSRVEDPELESDVDSILY